MPWSCRRSRVTASSHTSIDPHGRQGKSSAPTSRSWRAGMHGNEPAWWLEKRIDRAASRSGGPRPDLLRARMGALARVAGAQVLLDDGVLLLLPGLVHAPDGKHD